MKWIDIQFCLDCGHQVMLDGAFGEYCLCEVEE